MWHTKPEVTQEEAVQYVIKYKTKGSKHSQRATTSEQVLTLRQLDPNTLYIVNVRAIVGSHIGAWSDTALVKTPEKKRAVKQDSDEQDDIRVTNITQHSARQEDIRLTNITRHSAQKEDIRVTDITQHSARIVFNISERKLNVDNFRAFQIIVKSTGFKKDWQTLYDDVLSSDLTPDTEYTVNVYVIDNKGQSTKLGRVKFTTLDDVTLDSPQNLRVKSVSDNTFVVKWKPVTDADQYLVEYTDDLSSSAAFCSFRTKNSTKSLKIKGLLPDTTYFVRIASSVNQKLSEYSDWLNVTTESPDVESGRSRLRVYNISADSVLVAWQAGTSDTWMLRVYEEGHTDPVQHETNEAFHNAPEMQYHMISGLNSATLHRIVITSKNQETGCPEHAFTQFCTAFSDIDPECSPLPSHADTRLRMLTLPDDTHLITWSPAFEEHQNNNSEFVTVVRILGPPFLHPISFQVIPRDTWFLHVTEFDITKRQLINIMVFHANDGSRPEIDEKLLFLPSDDESLPTTTEHIFGTSLDHVVEGIVGDTDPDVHHVISKNSNFTIVSLRSTIDIKEQPALAPPKIDIISPKSVTEGERLDLRCGTVGDPYPSILWRTNTLSDLVNQCDSENNTIAISTQRFVGANRRSGSSYLGATSYLTINPVTHDDEGVYTCLATNAGGSDVSEINVIVHPKPPGTIQNLRVLTASPFLLNVTWVVPKIKTCHPRGHVTSYTCRLSEQSGYNILEYNVTETYLAFKDLLPETTFNVIIIANNKGGQGEESRMQISTRPIPKMTPPSHLELVTLNSTTMRVSWREFREVLGGQVRMRAFIFHYRKLGESKVDEIRIGKMFTNVSMIGLQQDQRYEVQVVALSEDGQRSQSGWVEGNTSREAYMNAWIEGITCREAYMNGWVETRTKRGRRQAGLRTTTLRGEKQHQEANVMVELHQITNVVFIETVPPPPPQNNILVSWLPPQPEANVLRNKERWEESSCRSNQ
ncbi:hypothetical protein DPMN_028534 [Dreissena polymorpha]|uniref:Uncharacterized protein n=1 Tax=Dreissena polymorpha TaxID=45954 RepID=A0A9D4LWH0_DREPO|nr:hypothetical protein DPMN_028534 [Dreissena polymorpha]